MRNWKGRVGNGSWFGWHFVRRAASKHCGHARQRLCRANGVCEVEEYARWRVHRADGECKMEEYARQRVCKVDGICEVVGCVKRMCKIEECEWWTLYKVDRVCEVEGVQNRKCEGTGDQLQLSGPTALQKRGSQVPLGPWATDRRGYR